MPSRRPWSLLLLCLALLLLAGFWVLGLFTVPLPPGITLHVPRAYLLTRNALWSAGALTLAVLLLTRGPIAHTATRITATLWLVWRLADTFLLQDVPATWPDVAIPLIGAGALLSMLEHPDLRRWLRHETPTPPG